MAAENELIVSVSGIRGIVGHSLTPEAALAFAAALGTQTQGGRMVLSRDGRPSGAMLRHAVLAGLLGAGCEVEDIGVAPTPIPPPPGDISAYVASYQATNAGDPAGDDQ